MRLSKQYPQQRAFITGAASGLGLALSETLVDEGWVVGMADVNESTLATVGETLRNAGATIHLYPLDVADAHAVQDVADAFIAQVGGVDVVINNAGISVGGPMEEIPLEDWHAIISINLMGVVHGCRAFIPHLKQAGTGHLINIASAAAIAASSRLAPYNVTKAGVLALSETLYGELHDAGVHVSVVMPTFFPTNISKAQRSSEGDRQMAEYLLSKSKYTAHDVANYIFKATGRKKIHILYPPLARKIWHFKRLLPKSYMKSLLKIHRSTLRYLARITKSKPNGK
jgi:short-subunit dehydrogenase